MQQEVGLDSSAMPHSSSINWNLSNLAVIYTGLSFLYHLPLPEYTAIPSQPLEKSIVFFSISSPCLKDIGKRREARHLTAQNPSHCSVMRWTQNLAYAQMTAQNTALPV